MLKDAKLGSLFCDFCFFIISAVKQEEMNCAVLGLGRSRVMFIKDFFLLFQVACTLVLVLSSR